MSYRKLLEKIIGGECSDEECTMLDCWLVQQNQHITIDAIELEKILLSLDKKIRLISEPIMNVFNH